MLVLTSPMVGSARMPHTVVESDSSEPGWLRCREGARDPQPWMQRLHAPERRIERRARTGEGRAGHGLHAGAQSTPNPPGPALAGLRSGSGRSDPCAAAARARRGRWPARRQRAPPILVPSTPPPRVPPAATPSSRARRRRPARRGPPRADLWERCARPRARRFRRPATRMSARSAGRASIATWRPPAACGNLATFAADSTCSSRPMRCSGSRRAAASAAASRSVPAMVASTASAAVSWARSAGLPAARHARQRRSGHRGKTP